MHSSDLQLARTLSLRLTGREVKQTATGAPPPTYAAYVRFPTPTAPPAVAASVPEPTSVPPQGNKMPPAPAEGFTCWQQLLSWCRQAARAESAFVVDAHGFVIAGEGGNGNPQAFEGIGAELCYTIDQLDRLDLHSQRLHAVHLLFEGRAIFGFRVGREEELVVGILKNSPVLQAAQTAIYSQVARSLKKLT